MKKIVLILITSSLSLLFASTFQFDQICDGAGNLNGTELEIAKKFPIGDCKALSKSRGGNLDDVDAVRDGMGVLTLAPIGQTATTNIQTKRNNKLVEYIKKHGEAAKKKQENLY